MNQPKTPTPASPTPFAQAREKLEEALLNYFCEDLGCDRDLFQTILQRFHHGVQTPAEALMISADALDTLEREALSFLSNSNLPVARSAFEKLIMLEPQRSSAWRGLAAAWHSDGQTEKAIYHYLYAVYFNPRDIVSWVALGECYWSQKKMAAAEQVLKMALGQPARHTIDMQMQQRARALLSAKPDNAAKKPATTSSNTAVTAQQLIDTMIEPAQQAAIQQDEEKARAALSTLKNLQQQHHNPFFPEPDATAESPQWQQQWASPQMQALLSDWAEAINNRRLTYKQVGNIAEKDIEASYLVAYDKLYHKKPLECLKILSWLVFIDSRNSKLYFLAGMACMHLQMWCMAEYHFNMATIYGPKPPHAAALIYRGECCIYLKQRHLGLSLLRQGLQAATGQPDALTVVNRAHELLQRFDVPAVSKTL